MAKYTNTTMHPILAPDSTMLAPGVATEVTGDILENARFKEMVDSKEIVAGEFTAEQLEKMRAEQAENPQPTPSPTPTPTPTATTVNTKAS